MTKLEVAKRVFSEIKNLKKYDIEKLISEAERFVYNGEIPKEGTEAYKFIQNAGIEE